MIRNYSIGLIQSLCAILFISVAPVKGMESFQQLQKLMTQYSCNVFAGYVQLVVENVEKNNELYKELKTSDYFPQSEDVRKMVENSFSGIHLRLKDTSFLDFAKVLYYFSKLDKEPNWSGKKAYHEYDHVIKKLENQKLKTYLQNFVTYNKNLSLFKKLTQVIRNPQHPFAIFFTDLNLTNNNFLINTLNEWEHSDSYFPASPRSLEGGKKYYDLLIKALNIEEKREKIDSEQYRKFIDLLENIKIPLPVQFPQEVPTVQYVKDKFKSDIEKNEELVWQEEKKHLSKEETKLFNFFNNPIEVPSLEVKSNNTNKNKKKKNKKKKKNANKNSNKEKLLESDLYDQEKNEYNNHPYVKDDSSITSIDDLIIEINDPKNKMKLRVLKLKDNRSKLKPEEVLKRATRIKKWFEDPIDMLVFRKELNQKKERSQLDEKQEYSIRSHAFAQIVDLLIERYGSDSQHVDKNGKNIPNKMLSAEVEFTDLKKKMPVLIAYGYSEKGECYHRFFTQKEVGIQFLEYLNDGKWTIECKED